MKVIFSQNQQVFDVNLIEVTAFYKKQEFFISSADLQILKTWDGYFIKDSIEYYKGYKIKEVKEDE